MRWAVYIAHMEEITNSYTILVVKSEWKRPLERPNRSWDDNIKMDLKEIRREDAAGPG
jgi:hypothetical protein